MRPSHMNDHESPPQDSGAELIYRYEDGYDAEIHPTFESLSRQFAEYAEGPFAAYNVPIWVEYERDCGDPAVSIGVVLTRHGLCMIWRSPATPAQSREIQRRTLSIWAARADVGFGRFMIRLPSEPTEGAE